MKTLKYILGGYAVGVALFFAWLFVANKSKDAASQGSTSYLLHQSLFWPLALFLR